jgi:hypothetical protein
MVPSLLCLFATSALTPLATFGKASLKFLSRSAAPVTSTIRRESAEQKAAQEQAVDGGDNLGAVNRSHRSCRRPQDRSPCVPITRGIEHTLID